MRVGLIKGDNDLAPCIKSMGGDSDSKKHIILGSINLRRALGSFSVESNRVMRGPN